MKQTEALESSNGIYQKLEAFIRSIIRMNWFEEYFIGLGLLYFLFTLFFEYFLWLKPMARAVLFWTFVGVEVLLRFIVFQYLNY
jgi:hypothetical protein